MALKVLLKKLIEAAKYWASGSEQKKVDKEKAKAEAKAWGFEWNEEEYSDDFEVIEENWEIVNMFLKIQTQWIMSFGGVVGLNYEILLLKGGLFDLYDVQNRKEVFDGIRVIESIVVQEINKKDGT